VKQGLFREDLYHRLNVIRYGCRPLRERRDDIPMLARHFLAQERARAWASTASGLTDAALQFLAAQEWPGNVRQLENVCHWVTVMAPGQVVDVKDLPPEVRGERRRGAATTTGAACSSARSRAASRAASRHRRSAHARLRDRAHREGAAAHGRAAHRGGGLLGIGRNTLTRKVQDLKIDTKD
jgi:two-component system nitrogen regulation response regulator GlnG